MKRKPRVKNVRTSVLKMIVDDDTIASLVKCGKQEATDEDYVNIAVRRALEVYLKRFR